MDAEVKAKWLEALKSGRYKKGIRALRDGNKFCCLGVLCDIKDGNLWDKVGSIYGYGSALNVGYLPLDVVSWAGFSQSSMIGGLSETQRRLSQLNDKSKTFEPVIEWIEENL